MTCFAASVQLLYMIFRQIYLWCLVYQAVIEILVVVSTQLTNNSQIGNHFPNENFRNHRQKSQLPSDPYFMVYEIIPT